MKSPSMKTPALATVYLDNERIGLMGDPRPQVAKIVAAGGKRPDGVQVLRALSATDLRGRPVRLEDVIDRTAEPERPIYLTSKPLPVTAHARGGKGHEAPRDSSPAVEFPTAAHAAPLALGSPLPGEEQGPEDDTEDPTPPRRARTPVEPEAEWDP